MDTLIDKSTDKTIALRNAIQQVLSEYHALNVRADSAIESVLVSDRASDNYLLLLMGWNALERIKTVQIHMRLHDDKIWIEEDWTEEGVFEDLLRLGIKPEAIVLAFQPPPVRQKLLRR